MSSKRFAIPVSVLLAAVLLLPGRTLSSGAANAALAAQPRQPSANAQPAAAPSQDPVRAAAAGRLMFIENAGQWPDVARFQVWGGSQTLWLAEDAIWITMIGTGEAPPEDLAADQMPRMDEPFALPRESHGMPRPYTTGVNLRLSFPGASLHPRLEPFDRLETHVSYFIGADPEKWRANVRVWGGVRYRNLYPGLDLEISGADGQWSWRLVSNPQSPISSPNVTLRVEGADAVAVDGDTLRLSTAAGETELSLLLAGGVNGDATVQPRGDQTFDVTAPFTSAHANLRPADASPHSPADNPADLLYGTFLGGSDYDSGNAIAVDEAGSAYVTGRTFSGDFPTTPGAFDTSYNDAFVVRLNPAGGALVYATFLGGSRVDSGTGYNSSIGYGIAVDAGGSAYVAGQTQADNFPTTLGAFDTSYNGGVDAFVVKLNPDGNALSYSTFLGGSGNDAFNRIALDATSKAYVTGQTNSSDFPVTMGAFDTSYSGDEEVYVAKLDPSGRALLYSTYLGGSDRDNGYAIAVDGAGNAYVTGRTLSSDFPTTPGTFDTTHTRDDCDAFIVKLEPAGGALAYATFLGGSYYDVALGIAVDAEGRAYVTGQTSSGDFPTTPGAFDTSYNGGADAFVARLNPTGNALVYATFLGGSGWDTGSAITVDSTGRTYVGGRTSSGDFPITPGAFDARYHGGHDYGGDAFVVKLGPFGNSLLYGTFLGGRGDDAGSGIAVDRTASAYVTGFTASPDFPASRGPGYGASYNGGGDAFVAKLLATPSPPPAILGTIWYDLDGDGLQDAGDPGLVAVVVKLFRHGQQIGQTATSGDGTYRFASLEADDYVVREVQPPWLRFSTTPNEVTVTVANGGEALVDFGDWNGRPLYLPLVLR